MIVRHATPEEFGALIDMGAAMHAESAFSFLPFDRDKVQRMGDNLHRNGNGCILVAEDDGEIVGMFVGHIVRYFFCDELLASDLLFYVRPEKRGGTTGARLINAFVKWAESNGAKEACIGISTKVNIERTGALCERLGFDKVGGTYKRRIG